MITVKYTSKLRADLGRERDLVQAGTIGELISELETRHGSAFTSWKQMFRIFINGSSIENHDGHQSLLSDGDEVVFMLPVAGG